MGANLTPSSGSSSHSSRSRRRATPIAEINVTPFVDVMLVLLIIFMVTAPLLTTGVEIELPEAQTKPIEQETETARITIDIQSQIFVDNVLVQDDTLDNKLREIAEQEADRQILLSADRRLDYGFVIAIMARVKAAGLHKIALLTNEQADIISPSGEISG